MAAIVKVARYTTLAAMYTGKWRQRNGLLMPHKPEQKGNISFFPMMLEMRLKEARFAY